MNKKYSVLIIGIISIIVLIAAQLLIIKGVWQQKDEMLYLRYRTLSQEAVVSLRGNRSIDVFDTVRFILDRYSEQVVKDLRFDENLNATEEKKKEILEYFNRVLNQEQDLSEYLSSYFEQMGFDKEFNHRIEIINLNIIDADTLNVYQRERSTSYQPSDGIASLLNGSKSSIPVSWFHLEDNFYSLNFDYIIDFSDKRRMILREISLSLAMSIFSIAVVVMIFLFTYRNLSEEKRLSDLKTDFINNMTHELKTPLATITVAGKTLEMQKVLSDESKIRETARLIGKQSIHLNQLINMILEISMWERTQFQLDRKKCDIVELMNDIVESFITGCGNCVNISQNYNLSGIKAEIDVIYFTTMLNNLLSNAVKYSAGEPEIQIEGLCENNSIILTIADNGIGIGKTDQKYIFDKFYRASSGNIHKYKGLGLGLYYVKKIASAHGGDVTVTSKPGKGSIFTITIPYK